MYSLIYHDVSSRGIKEYSYILTNETYELCYEVAWMWSLFTGKTTQIIFTGWPYGWDHYKEA